jgi:hypothetical protein
MIEAPLYVPNLKPKAENSGGQAGGDRLLDNVVRAVQGHGSQIHRLQVASPTHEPLHRILMMRIFIGLMASDCKFKAFREVSN